MFTAWNLCHNLRPLSCFWPLVQCQQELYVLKRRLDDDMTSVPTEAYSRPLSFMARYLLEKSPFMATTPTSTAVISMMPAIQRNIQQWDDIPAVASVLWLQGCLRRFIRILKSFRDHPVLLCSFIDRSTNKTWKVEINYKTWQANLW